MGKILVIALALSGSSLFAADESVVKICDESGCSEYLASEFLAPTVIGNCYAIPNCTGAVIAYGVTTNYCEAAGGHSINSAGICYSF